MKTFENFLKKPLYTIVILSYFLIIWSLKFFMSGSFLQDMSLGLLILPALLWVFLLYAFKNVSYSVPIILGVIFSLGIEHLNLDTIQHMTSGFIVIFLFITGLIVHTIKYKPTFKLKTLGLGFLLAALSFLIPLTYTEVNLNALMLASMGLVYVAFYLFYANTLTAADVKSLIFTILLVGLLLTAQVLMLIIDFVIHFEGGIYESLEALIKHGGLRPLGWGNINDLTIHLVLFTCAPMYYIYKHPEKLIYWLLLSLNGFLIYLSFSRGSMLTYTLLMLLIVGYTIYTRDKQRLKNMFIFLGIYLSVLLINLPLLLTIIETFSHSISGDLNQIGTGRITLWEHAVETFKTYPLFGSGWYTDLFILAPGQNRITIYHSTFFQVLATGGIFGMLVLTFHFYQVGKLFYISKQKVFKYMFLVTYLITQIHGMADITQYMFVYTMSTIILFVIIEMKPLEEDILLK